MKYSIILFLLSLSALSGFGQDYPFAKDFVDGTIVFKDSSTKTGQLKWFPQQTQKLRFRESEKGETVKYSPEEIAGFSVDTLRFVSLYKFDVYADEYALLGRTSTIKHTFGQVLDTGKFNIYFVSIVGVNAINNAVQTYPNFLFQNTQDTSLGLVAYPFAIRMKDKKYDKAKENLYLLFKDYPDIIQKIRDYKQQDDFFEVINMVKAVNGQ